MQRYDLAIIGGGIHGAGIGRDAAGRGLSVLLIEQHDLASATSSASTKLIHGGLRYLEYFRFRLVSESLAERETLLAIAPHIVQPLQFVLPHERHLRPQWMIGSGLFLYDALARAASALHGRRVRLPRSHRVRLDRDGLHAGLKAGFEAGFCYFDCRVDDARLVVLNARSAASRGARVLTRTRLIAARRSAPGPDASWWLVLRGRKGDQDQQVSARVLVNAAGPWAQAVLEQVAGITTPWRLRLIRGSHIVVPRLYLGSHAFVLQNPDRRIVFMIPYEDKFTLIGTTEVPIDGPLEFECAKATASEAEVAYLCEAASRYSAIPVKPADVVWTYSGVRALYDDGRPDPSAVTRGYHLLLDAGEDAREAPVLSVFGGKITTYRRLAEHSLAKLERWFPGTLAWTHAEALPGGDFTTFAELQRELERQYPQLPASLLVSLARRHGTLARAVLGQARKDTDLGEHFGAGLYEAEVRYFVAKEWAREAEDVLWRRTKCGLHLSPSQRLRVADAMRALV